MSEETNVEAEEAVRELTLALLFLNLLPQLAQVQVPHAHQDGNGRSPPHPRKVPHRRLGVP